VDVIGQLPDFRYTGPVLLYASNGMEDLVRGFVGGLFRIAVEGFMAASGRRLLSLFGWRNAHEAVSLLAGLALWFFLIVVACGLGARVL
jgi:hypothetical protein